MTFLFPPAKVRSKAKTLSQQFDQTLYMDPPSPAIENLVNENYFKDKFAELHRRI